MRRKRFSSRIVVNSGEAPLDLCTINLILTLVPWTIRDSSYSAKQQAYTPIVAAGSSAGTLHYIANDLSFPTEGPGSLLLVDAGGEYKNYASDVTRCIPVSQRPKTSPLIDERASQ